MQQCVILFSLCPDQLNRSTGVNTLQESKTLYTGVKDLDDNFIIKLPFGYIKLSTNTCKQRLEKKGLGGGVRGLKKTLTLLEQALSNTATGANTVGLLF